MADEGKGIALAILGIVAVIAVVGLVLLFTGATGKYVLPSYEKVYTRQSEVGVAGGKANVENPYYGYAYETYGGVSESRYATGKDVSAGGAWQPDKVFGESPYVASDEPGVGSAPAARYSPTYKRAPQSIPSGQLCANEAGFCPYGSVCQPDPRRVGENWIPVAGYPGCYVAETAAEKI